MKVLNLLTYKLSHCNLLERANYYRLRGSASLCNDDKQSRWKNGDFNPHRSEIPESFITKIKLDIFITS